MRVEDRNLQWFRWQDKLFVELGLVFGTRSRTDIYDIVAKVVLAIILALSQFPQVMVCQYLLNMGAAELTGLMALHVFRELYWKVAKNFFTDAAVGVGHNSVAGL